jgi:hypothetical protein
MVVGDDDPDSPGVVYHTLLIAAALNGRMSRHPRPIIGSQVKKVQSGMALAVESGRST